MDVGPAFVADAQATERAQPRDRAFNDPAEDAQVPVLIGAAFRQPRIDAAA